jgi:His-Xaa-Ser system protein HxsD
VQDNSSQASMEFTFDLKLFRLSAVKKAAYRFAGPFTVEFAQLSDSRLRVTLSRRQDVVSQLDASHLPNEVLDQELREIVAEETKSVRDLLLAQTFSGLSVVDPVGENADYQDDPLGIAARQKIPVFDAGA